MLRETYDRTCRDIVYAYRGADTFLQLDRLYTTSTAASAMCRFVLIIDVHHAMLERYIQVAEKFIERHGLLIASLTWFRTAPTQQQQLRNADRRLFEQELLRFEEKEVDDDDDDDDDDNNRCSRDTDANGGITTAAAGAMTSNNICSASNTDIAMSWSRQLEDNNVADDDDDEVAAKDDHDNENGGDDANSGHNADSLHAVTTIRAVYDNRNNHMNMRNHILAQFFAKFIFYIRTIPVCDNTGLISHKSFRLIHPHTVNTWLYDIVSSST